jgi:hypothetical protein
MTGFRSFGRARARSAALALGMGAVVIGGLATLGAGPVAAADTVEATNVTVSSPTVFPVVDGYRDKVSATGLRAEPIAVAFVVRNARGTAVRAASVALGTGPYAWTWNGRSNANKIVPAGKYTISQTLRDAAGTTKVVKSTVTVSLKRLVRKTFSQTKTLAQRAWTGFDGAATGWVFTVPAGAQYQTLTTKVYGRGSSAAFATRLRACSGGDWNLDCYDGIKELAPALAWYASAVPGATHVSPSHQVHVVVVRFEGAIQKVSVTLGYSVLQ